MNRKNKSKRWLIISGLILLSVSALLSYYHITKYQQDVRSRASDVVYRYDLTGSDSDTKLFVSTAQGIINRDGPSLYIYDGRSPAVEADRWWDIMSGEEEEYMWLVGKQRKNVTSPSNLLEVFGHKLKGVVVWDPQVPATLNVATTVAGVKDLAVITYDEKSDSIYHKVVVDGDVPVVVDLRGKFTGKGSLPNEDFSGYMSDVKSTGSKKVDAYLWAKIHYLDTNKTDPHILGEIADSWTPSGYTRAERN